MNLRKKYFLLIALFLFSSNPIFSFAQTQSSLNTQPKETGPSQADIDAVRSEGSTQAVQIADERSRDEESKMRSEFESQFGAPPEAFQKREPQKPQFEQPQRVPEEAKKYLKDQELVPIYCAMVRWKTGHFFESMNALKNNLLPAMQKAKDSLKIEQPLPNIDKIIEDGNGKINTICSAKTLAEAEDITASFAEMGQDFEKNGISAFVAEFENKMKAKGDEIKSKIEALIPSLIEEEKAKIKPELEQEAKSYTESNINIDHQPSPEEMAQIRAQVENYLKPKIEAKKQEVAQRIQARVNEIKEKEIGEAEGIGKLFDGMDQKIKEESQKGLEKYDQYKKEAFILRKEAILKILNKNLEEGLKQLDSSEKDIEEARKEDSSIKSVSQIKSEIDKDKKILEEKLNSALESNNESAFQEAINEFKTKWEKIRNEGEKAAEQSITKACEIANSEFTKARSQMQNNLYKIEGLEKRCAGSVTDDCLRIAEFSDRFGTIKNKINELKSAMEMLEGMCANPNKKDRVTMIALMRKIQGDGEDLRTYGAALEAEKSKTIADSVEKMCAKSLPQLRAIGVEIAKNDLSTIKNNLTRCSGKTTEDCAIINQLSSKVNQFTASVNIYNERLAEAEDFCRNPNENYLERMATTLNTLGDVGEKFRALGKELLELQAEKASKKALCKAVIPQLDKDRSDISKGFVEVSNIQANCGSKTDDICKAINNLKLKFDDVQSKMLGLQSKINLAIENCNSAGTEVPDEIFTKNLNDVKAESEQVKKNIQNLKDEQEKAKRQILIGTWIEAEDELNTKLLPNTEAWHSKEEINPSWRPPYFGTGVWYLSRGGEYLQYRFYHQVTQIYNIWVRDYVDNLQPSGIRKVTYYINGNKITTTPEVSLPKDKINPQKGAFAWHKIATLKINGGWNILKVEKEKTTSGAAILDVFYITGGNETPPEK